MRSGWRWVAHVASHRGSVMGRFATRRLWSWVRHHPWDAWLVLQVLDTARDPRVSSTAARLVEQAWESGAMRPRLHRAIATHVVPFPPHPRTHLARRVAYAHFTGDVEERRRLDPDGRILARCLGHRSGYGYGLSPGLERRWTVDAERERQLAARQRGPELGGGSGGSGPSGGGHGISGSGYGSSGFGGSF